MHNFSLVFIFIHKKLLLPMMSTKHRLWFLYSKPSQIFPRQAI